MYYDTVYWLHAYPAHSGSDVVVESTVHLIAPNNVTTACGLTIPSEGWMDYEVTRCSLPVTCGRCHATCQHR